MSQAHDENTWNLIQEVAFDFEVCARLAVECLLNRPTLVSRDFGTQTRFPAEPEIRCIMESGNRDYSLVISLGLSHNDLRTLFSKEKDADMALDAIGEMVNITAGRLFVRPGFNSRFGCMRASIPSFEAPSLDMEQSGIIRGVLLMGEANLGLELAIKWGNRGGVA